MFEISGLVFVYLTAQFNQNIQIPPAIGDIGNAVVQSFGDEGAAVADWLFEAARGATAFYDIDTPVTLRKLADGDDEYLAARQIPRFDLYLSFTGGPLLDEIGHRFGARRPRALYCSCDPALHRPVRAEPRWELGYLGTYSADRQPILDALLVEPARRSPAGRFIVAGAQYPDDLRWPENVERRQHVAPDAHASFYCAQRYTLNITRADMVRAGWSPSVRLFEAAACGVPIISDAWPGIEQFFEPGREIRIANTSDEVLAILDGMTEPERVALAARARERVLRDHTATRRAASLEAMTWEALGRAVPAISERGT
mgnify:CR=1 FL=1